MIQKQELLDLAKDFGLQPNVVDPAHLDEAHVGWHRLRFKPDTALTIFARK